jgi:hypothetical protein
MTAVLDHLAIGTADLTDGWELLGGSWAYGGASPGFWFGQLKFAAGPHHFNFIVTDIEATLARIRAHGIEPAGDDTAALTWPDGKRITLVREEGLPLGGSLQHVRFARRRRVQRPGKAADRPTGRAPRPDGAAGLSRQHRPRRAGIAPRAPGSSEILAP